MKKEDTKQVILDKALELFSEKGYDAVSVADIAAAVGIKAPSLYNHFASKEAIFQAIVQSTYTRYEQETGKNNIHVQDVAQDVGAMQHISAETLKQKIRWMFSYSVHDKQIACFRKMMTLSQFRSTELADMFTTRYVDRIVAYHAEIFRSLIAAGEIVDADPETLAAMYVAPVRQLIGICDRQPEKEAECLEKLDKHAELFFKLIHEAKPCK